MLLSKESPFSPHVAIRGKGGAPRDEPSAEGNREKAPRLDEGTVTHTCRGRRQARRGSQSARLAPFRATRSVRAGSGLPRSGFVQRSGGGAAFSTRRGPRPASGGPAGSQAASRRPSHRAQRGFVQQEFELENGGPTHPECRTGPGGPEKPKNQGPDGVRLITGSRRCSGGPLDPQGRTGPSPRPRGTNRAHRRPVLHRQRRVREFNAGSLWRAGAPVRRPRSPGPRAVTRPRRRPAGRGGARSDHLGLPRATAPPSTRPSGGAMIA